MSEESTVMLSALQHYLFCPRQCALIHVEGVWNENFLTASGRQLHERVDRRGGETRKDVHLATARRWIGKQLVAISRYQNYFPSLPAEIREDVYARMRELIEEEKAYCDKGNYKHMAQILTWSL
jgi:CRISPR/Cas system-associated exonuclease Cas4 (RecB family)